MIDEFTRARLNEIEVEARKRGTSLFEELDRYGLLSTYAETRKSQRAALIALYQKLEDMSPTALAALGGNQTITGAVGGCLKFIELFLKTLEN